MRGNKTSFGTVDYRRFGWWIGIVVILPLCLTPAVSGSDHDFEVWTWEKFWVDLSGLGLPEHTNLYLENANRFDQDVSRQFQFHQRIGIRFDIPWLDGWSIMPVWQHVDYEPGSNEDRYHFDLAYSRKNIFDSNWSLKFRFRMDLRDLYDKDQISERFRPKISFSHPLPIEIEGRPIKVYFSNEVNYDTTVDQFNRHRFGTGFNLPITPKMTWGIGYQIETNRLKNNSWDSDSMLMTGLTFRF